MKPFSIEDYLAARTAPTWDEADERTRAPGALDQLMIGGGRPMDRNAIQYMANEGLQEDLTPEPAPTREATQWDAYDEPDYRTPTEMIQPGAEDPSAEDNVSLDTWLNDRVNSVTDEPEAVQESPAAEAAEYGMRPPRGNSAKVSFEPKQGTDWGRLGLDLINPSGADARQKRADEIAQQSVKDSQETQKLAQERRRLDENEAYRRDNMGWRREAAGGNLEARNRWLDIRENTALTPEQRAELQRSGANERIRVNAANEAGKNRRTAMMSGRRDLMEAEGVLDPRTQRPPIQSQQEGIAEAFRQEMEQTEGFEITPRVEAVLGQIARFDKEGGWENPLRGQLVAQVNKMLDDHRERNAGAASEIEKARRQENIPQTIADVDQALEVVERNRDPRTGDVPGLSRFDRAASRIPLVGGAVDSINRLAEGAPGEEVRAAVKNLYQSLVVMRTGMASTMRDTSAVDQVLGLDWEADPEAFVRAAKNFRARLENMDASIVQGHGVQGGRTFANRREGAVEVAPRLQPGQTVNRGGRRYTVVP